MSLNPSPNAIAQTAHFFIASTIILGAAAIGRHTMIPSIAIVCYGILKEFVWDLKFETPEVSGGLLGGLQDFAFYILGMAAANAIVLAHAGAF